MDRKFRLYLGLFTGVGLVGWTYLLMCLENSGAWGDHPDNWTRLTLCALPYLGLGYDLLTCLRPNRLLLRLGLILNLPALVLAVSWFSYPNGILPGYLALLYVLGWYAYAMQMLRVRRDPKTMAPFRV